MSFYSLSSYSQLRVNQSAIGGTPPSFQNLNSFLFDGVDDKMFSTANYTEINGTQNFSVSFWLKPIDVNSGLVFRFGKQNSTSRLACIYYPSIEIVIISFGTSSYYYRSVNGSIPLNQWSHIVYTYDGTQSRYNRPEIYVNGVLSQGTNSGVTNSQSTFDGTLELGGTGTSGQQNFGNNYIDEFAVWNNTTLTQTQANELYNGGTPSDLNNIASGLTSPTTWFRCGDLSVWNGFTWTMTDVNGGTTLRGSNMQESSRTTDVPPNPFANTKSIQLDGIDDYVDCGDNDNLSFGDGSTDSPFSISTWWKMHDYVSFRGLQKFDSISNCEYRLNTLNSGKLKFTLFDNNSSNYIGLESSTDFSGYEDLWINLIATYDGSGLSSGLKVYLNGSILSTVSDNGGSYTAMHNTSSPFRLAKLTSAYADGLIDETAVFNSELSQSDVTSIYGGGSPSSLSSYSSLVSWWRCGDGDTSPILTDNGSGGNDGTMTNFTTFSTDVPT